MAENPKAARKYEKAKNTTDRTLYKYESAGREYEKNPTQANKDKLNTTNKVDSKAYAKRVSLSKAGRAATLNKRLPAAPGTTVKNTGKGTATVNGKRVGGKSLGKGKK
jgi:hypothetical protein